jgi:hypothetical protein
MACGLAQFVTFLGASKLNVTAIRELLRHRAYTSKEANSSGV